MTQTGPETQHHRTQRPTRPRRRLWITLACLVLLLLVAVISLKPARWFEPTYEGKPVSQWFEEYVRMTNFNYSTWEAMKPFLQMQGTIEPHLIGWLEREPSPADRVYARLHRIAPKTVGGRLPQPRDSRYYLARRSRALYLLEHIAQYQRRHDTKGNASAPPMASIAVPNLRSPLINGDDYTITVIARILTTFGPASAPLVPELVRIAADPDHPASHEAIGALGAIGPGASNAVGTLREIAASDRVDRMAAIEALGGIGPASRNTVPLFIPMLHENRTDVARSATAQAMARIGFTPDEAVPLLNRMRNSTNISLQLPATLALWNRDPDDPVLTRELRTAFVSNPHSLLTLASDSPHASRFLPEITALLDHPDKNTRRNAARAVRKIKGNIP